MREGWKYKRISDICDVLDSQRKPVTKSDRQSGAIPYYGATGIQDYVKDYIFDGRYLLVGEDGAKWGKDDNTAFIIEGKSWVNNHAHILKVHNCIIDSYLRYFLNGKDLTSYITGAVVPKLTQGALVSIEVPVPPLPEQERIVAELDLLTGIIDKQKAQLKELDTLTQSIFYDMFGDPNEERQWDSVLFESVCSSMTKGPFGSDIKKSLYVPKSDSTYKVYIQANAIEKNLSLGTYYITKEYFDSKMFRFEVHPFDYIITCDGTLGRYIQLPENIEKGIISASLLRITLKDSIAAKYFEFLWDNYLMGKLTSDIRNSALVHLPSATKIGKVTIPLPPLSLQQSFAQKIQSIESQKDSINRSIAETQKIFDYTMDKYFG